MPEMVSQSARPVNQPPSFVNVNTASGYDLQGLKLGPQAAGDGTEMIQVLDLAGQNNESWVWLNENVGMAEGWYDFETWELISRSINNGEGFLMTVDSDVELQVAGQVGGATTIELPAGFSVIGNNTPIDISIQDIKLGSTAAGDGTEMIQVLDAAGQNNVSWVWLNENVGMAEGWYDFETWELIDETVNAGTAYLITVDSDTTITIPSAL